MDAKFDLTIRLRRNEKNDKNLSHRATLEYFVDFFRIFLKYALIIPVKISVKILYIWAASEK